MENGQLSSDPAHSGSINKSGEKTFHRHETLLKPLSQVESRQWAKTWPLHRELFFLGILHRLRSSQDIGKTSPFRQSAGGTIWNGLHAKKRKRWRGKKENRYFLGRIMGFYMDYGNIGIQNLLCLWAIRCYTGGRFWLCTLFITTAEIIPSFSITTSQLRKDQLSFQFPI